MYAEQRAGGEEHVGTSSHDCLLREKKREPKLQKSMKCKNAGCAAPVDTHPGMTHMTGAAPRCRLERGLLLPLAGAPVAALWHAKRRARQARAVRHTHNEATQAAKASGY